MRRRFPQLWMFLALVLVISGCSVGAAPQPPPAPPSARDVLGDFRTLDPCSLVDAKALSKFGEATNAGLVSLDYCLLHVSTSDGSLAQVTAGQLDHVDVAEETKGTPVVERGPVRILREAPLPGHCGRPLLFADGTEIQVSADLLSGQPGAPLCGIAEAGANAVATALEQDRVRHRALPENSLARVDPCRLVDPATIHDIPGLEKAAAHPNPAGHQCEWGEHAADSARIRLVHTAGDPPKVLHGAAVEESIADRRTVISMVGQSPRVPLCSAETAHIPLAAARPGQTEVAMLVVALPGEDGIEACEVARGLAERIWPRLPRS